jgi:hypothetical protein
VTSPEGILASCPFLPRRQAPVPCHTAMANTKLLIMLMRLPARRHPLAVFSIGALLSIILGFVTIELSRPRVVATLQLTNMFSQLSPGWHKRRRPLNSWTSIAIETGAGDFRSVNRISSAVVFEAGGVAAVYFGFPFQSHVVYFAFLPDGMAYPITSFGSSVAGLAEVRASAGANILFIPTVMNAVAYSVTYYIFVTVWVASRTSHRRKNGCCLGCGYSMAGLTRDIPLCPECSLPAGWHRDHPRPCHHDRPCDLGAPRVCRPAVDPSDPAP